MAQAKENVFLLIIQATTAPIIYLMLPIVAAIIAGVIADVMLCFPKNDKNINAKKIYTIIRTTENLKELKLNIVSP